MTPLVDRFGRRIEYLRISVTDRCNFRCVYCLPAAGCAWKPAEEILRFEEIVRIVRAMAALGIRRLRITGGEPLVRRDIPALIEQLVQLPGIEEVALSTNGLLLERFARALKAAGLSRVNVSLDSLDPATFAQITRVGCLDDVLRGIRAALDAGLHPVKVNCVLLRGINEEDILHLARLSIMQPLHVRFIELMPLGNPEFYQPDRFLSVAEAKARCEVWGELIPVTNGLPGSGPATVFRYEGAQGTVGFIGAMTCNFCRRCNRLRLTSDGWLRPCLDSRTGANLREPLRRGDASEALQQIIRDVVARKPASHHMTFAMRTDEIETMCAVGG